MVRKRIVSGLVVLVVTVFSFAALFIISQRQRYAVKEGKVIGVLKISDMGIMSHGATSHPIYLLGDDGNKYRLQKATNQETHSVIMSAREGERLKVAGRFWRPRKGRTQFKDTWCGIKGTVLFSKIFS